MLGWQPDQTVNSPSSNIHMKLFKYVNEDRISILEDGLVRFTQPQVFNDPFELKPNIASIASSSQLEDHLKSNFQTILRSEYEKLPDQVKKMLPFPVYMQFAESKRGEVLCGMKELAEQATPLLKKIVHKSFEKHVGILSVTESPYNLLMWSHYANNHQGFVIEFDGTHPFFNQRKSEEDDLRYLSKVTYSEKRPALQLAQINSWNELLLIKSKEWAYEQEWRMFMSLSDANRVIKEHPYDIYLFKVPFDAIRAILIGARATLKTRERISSAVVNNPELAHATLFEMRTHEEKFELIMEKKSST